MTIPTGTNFPTVLDTDENLFLVRDSLRLRLASDYNPGNTSILVEGDPTILLLWPDNGLLTLTEQCSELDKRAISFHYAAIDRTNGIISGLEILPEFTDVPKLKRITHVTQNVMAESHNILKDALIAIEGWIGRKGTIDDHPFGPTLEGRINFLRKLVMQPKAWFEAKNTVGIGPLTVQFTNMSFRLGTDGLSRNVEIHWDFGDGTALSVPLTGADTDENVITKTYATPGVYTVSLTAVNDFGQDTCTFPDLVKVRITAPTPAIIQFHPSLDSQMAVPGSPVNGPLPFEVMPTIRSPINTLIEISIDSPHVKNPATSDISFAGEPLSPSGYPLDPIETYTWRLADDLEHTNAPSTKAMYSSGGIYDLKLRVDTELGAYRITAYEDAIDVIENVNLWLWLWQSSNTVRAYEYGLISQTFKLNTAASLVVNRDDSFLTGMPLETTQKREFRRNAGLATHAGVTSGEKGTATLYWASGRSANDTPSTELINMVEFNGFLNTYTTGQTPYLSLSPIHRPWNWASLNSRSSLYFVFGGTTATALAGTSPTNLIRQAINLTTNAVEENYMMTADELTNGAAELQNNPALFDPATGDSIYGDFSVYRTAWKDNTGYIARNEGVGPTFRIKNFYQTQGTVGQPFISIKKLSSIQGGPTRYEGQMVDLMNGIYFFDNTGSVSMYNDTTGTWFTGGPGINSASWKALQDASVADYDNPRNTLLAASDGDRRAYLSYDYSPNAFLKFNQVDTTFTTLGSRPVGEQWVMSIY